MPSSFKDSAGNVFLLGNFFELGISPDGNFGTSDAPPTGYYVGKGESLVGMVYNPAGLTAANTATNLDFFLPGTPLELFSAGYTTPAGVNLYGTNYYIGTSTATPISSTAVGSLHQISDFSLTNTSTSNTLSATYIGIYNGNLQVTITYSFGVNDLYYSADVTLKNISATSMNDARYLRMVNPDNTSDYTNNKTTVNTIIFQQPGSGASLVLAQNSTPDAYQTATGHSAIFGYYSTDPNTRVSILSIGNVPSTTTNAAFNPFTSSYYTTAPAVNTTTTANDNIVIDYDAGALAAGASKSFTYSSLLTSNVAATIAAINSNTPPTFTGGVNVGLTLAQNATITTITNAILKVVDAEQASSSLTYTIATATTKGILTKSGVTLTANSTFTQADIDNGLIGYTPTSGINGADNLVFGVSDGAGGLLSAQTFNLTIVAPPPVVVNNPPVAVNDAGSATEAGGNNNSENANPAVGNVLTNDIDVDGRALSISAIRTGNIEGSGAAGTVGQVIAGTYGNLTLNANGSYTYVVNDSNSTVQALKLGDTLTESFNYTVYDNLLTDIGVLTLTINGSNDSPSVTNLNGDSSVFWLGSSTPVLLDVGQDALVTDPDTTNYNNTMVSVSFAPGSLGSGVFSVDGTTIQSGNDNTISVGELVSVSGVTIGTVTANDKASNGLAILLNANATATSVQTLLQNIYYIENPSDTTGAGDRLFNIQINEPNTTAMTPAVVKLTEKIPVPSLSLSADTGISASDTITNSGVVNVSGLASNATWQYSTDNSVNWTTGSGIAFTLIGDGNKSVIVRQIDAAGNVGLNSSALAFTLDRTIATPSLVLVNDTGNPTDAITSDGRVAVSNLETGASWQYSQDGGVNWTTGSGSNFNLTGDGDKSVMVRQTDIAGNLSSNSNTLNFTLDTSVATPILTLTNDTGISSSDAISSNGLVTVSNLENSATWQYSDSGIGWIIGSGTNFTLTGDGAKSVVVSQTDVAGNISSNSNTLNFTLDTNVATPTLTLTHDTGSSNSDGITDDGTVSVTNLETGSSWQYSQDGGTNWTTGSGSSFTLTGNGTKSVIVRQTDIAGNLSSNSNTLNFMLDTSVGTPILSLTNDTGSSNSDGITNDGTVGIASLEIGANWQYSQDGGTNWTTGSGSNFTLTGDGTKSVIVRQTDIAGNLSSNSTPLNFTLDTRVATPILTLTHDTGSSNSDSITDDGTVSVTNLETGSSWQYSQDGGTNWTMGSGSNFTLTGDGAKSIVVNQTDVAGNLSSNSNTLNFTLDTRVATPILSLVNDTGSSNSDGITNEGTVGIANLETGSSWQYSQDSGVNWMTGNGPNFTLTGDGTKSVVVNQTDVAGNLSSNSNTLNFTLDTRVATQILSLVNDTGSSNSDSITNDGTVGIANLETGSSWQYSQDSGVNWMTGSGSSFTLTGDGTKSVVVNQTDVAGNLSSNSPPLNFTLDTRVATPILTLTHDTGSSNSDGITDDVTVSIANLETGASWQYSQDSGVNWMTGSGSNFTLTGDGMKSVVVNQIDVAGNLSSNSNTLNFTLDTGVGTPILSLTNDTGSSNSDGITDDGTFSIANLETGASWQYSQDGGVNWMTGSGSNFTLTGDGTKSVVVNQTDVAGNLSSNSTPLNFTLDTRVATPILSLTNDTGNSTTDGITNNGTVSIANLETGSSWQYSQDSGVNWTTGSGSNFTLTGDGTKSVFVRQTDVAGNVSLNSSTLNFTLDTRVTMPTLTLTHDTGNSTTDGITNDGTVSIANLETGSSWQYSQDSGVNWMTGSGFSFALTGDGTKSVFVRQTDVAGNLSTNRALTFTLDTSVSTPILSLTNDTGSSNSDGITRDGSISIANLETGASWQYSQDGGVNWTTGSGAGLTLTDDGYKSVMVRQTDVAGNTSLNSSVLTFTLKSTESTPILTLNNDTGSQNNDRITSDGTVNISDLTNTVSWQYSLDNGNSWMVGSGSSFVLYGDGNKSVIAQKTDAAGNVSTSDALNFMLDTNATTLGLALEADTGKNNDNVTSDGTVIVSGIENGASWQYSLDGGINWTQRNGTNFTLVGDGDKSVLVEQTDVAGNNSIRSSLNFTLDSTALAPTLALTNDTGISTTDRITDNGSVSVIGLENGASWEYSLDNGKNWITGSGTSFTLTGDGYKSVVVRQTDIAGNISTNSAPLNFILDQSVSVPELTLNTDTGNAFDGITSDGTVNVSGLENGAVWEYSTDNGSIWKSGTGNTFKLTGDGNKSVIVHQTDAAGNISPNSISLNFTLDSIALPPELSLENDTGNSNTDAITRDGRINVSNLENGASWQYSQDGGLNWITGQGNGFTLTGDGNKSVVVRQNDIAGNISANSNTLNFTLDTNVIAPSLALLEDTGYSNTDAITNNGTISVSGIENGANWQYSTDSGANWITGQGNSFTLTGDGYKSALVRQIDVAGNTSTISSPLNFTLDTLAVTPTLTLINDTGNSSTDRITSDSRMSVSNLENGASWQYSTDNGVNWITGIGNILTLADDGIKSVITRQIDVAGNISSNSLPLNLTLDTTVKTLQLALINDTGSSNTDGITQDGLVSVSNLENGANWQYSQDGGLNWTVGNGNSFTLFGEGEKSVIVRQTDVAGNASLNSSTLTFNLQNNESTPILALNNDTGNQANDRITRDGTITISDLKNAVSWRYSLDNGNTWTVGSNNNWNIGNNGSFTLLGDGNKSVIAQKTDAAGNISTSNVFNFTLDTNAAALNLVLKNDTGIDNDSITSDGTVIVSGIENGASWQYSQDNGSNWTEGSGTGFTLIGDGNKSVIVRQTDVAGNSSKNSDPLNFTLNSSALSPILKLAQDTGSSNTDKITSNGMVNVYGLENGASWEYSQDGGVSWITGNGTSFTLTGDGNKSVVVRQTDITGNISTNSAPLNFTLEQSATAPVLTLNADTGSSNTDKITNDGNIHISDFKNGATWQYSNDAGKNWITGNSTDFTVVDDGDKSIIARQIDVAGNISANSLPLNFTLNTLINAPVLTLKNDTGINNDKITSDGTVAVTNLGKNVSWEYSLDNGTNWITGSGNSITLTGDGGKSIMARQTDVAGNVSTISAPLNFVLDSTVATPILTLKNDTGYSNTDKITSDGTVIISGLENGVSWEYSQDDGTTWKTGSGNSIMLTGDGNKSILAKETDIAGNISDIAKFEFTLRSIESKFNADVKNLLETDSILTTSGKLTGTNTDKTTITLQTASVGKYGTFDIDQTGNWHYTTSSPHNEFLQDNVYVDSFPVITSDGQKTSVTIDITGTKDLPIVIDDVARQSIKPIITNGVPQNVLYGQLGLQSAQGKDIAQNTDKSWTSLDLTPVTFNLDKGQVAGKDTQGHTLLKMTLANGSTMTLNTWDGSYVYVSSTSSSTIDTTDIFNFSADGVPLVMSLNRYDFLDLDGIPDNVETNLANLATSADAIKPAVSGDSNNDGIADKFQGAVADIAWISYVDFKAALDNKLSSPKSVINIVVASDNLGKVDNVAQLNNIEVLPSNSVVVGGSKPQSTQISAPWDPLQFSVSAGTSAGLKDIDSVRLGTQVLVLIDIARASVSDFNGYMKYISAETINDYKAAGLPLITLDGEKLTSATQAGWYDYTQRTKGGDGAWFIKDATGKITKIAMIMTDNSFGDDNLAGNEITDPGLPIVANPPIVPTPPSDNTLKSDTNVSALPAEFNNLILQDTQIDQTVTKTELVDNPLLCLPQWTQKLLSIPAKISQAVTTTEKIVAPLNGVGNDLDNKIIGNSADNILNGLGGADTLTGGDGADTFVYLDKSDSPATNFDSITDFNIAQGDKIDLSEVDANSNLAGKQTFTYLGSASFTGQAGQLRFDSQSHMLLGDTQGSGNADFAIQLLGVSTLPAVVLI